MNKTNVTDYDDLTSSNYPDYDNFTSTNYIDTNICTNIIDIIIPSLLKVPCSLSFFCLLNLMVYTLIEPFFNNKQKIYTIIYVFIRDYMYNYTCV